MQAHKEQMFDYLVKDSDSYPQNSTRLIMAYLSREDIEKIAEDIISQYKKQYLPEHYMCYMVDVTELAEKLGFRIEYVHITKDGSILGQTSSGRI